METVDWMMLTAGSMTDPALRETFVSKVYQFATADQSNTPLTLYYETSSGVFENISSRYDSLHCSDLAVADYCISSSPAQGAMFSLLALK